ncbi:MAG: hypothetical protein IJ087_03950 [Eggerthellaceae bacterium]|nr:hypothetical protein [Eggerthellaceae bacterium]
MKQAANTRYFKSPSARQPRHKRIPLPTLGAYQVGRAVRTWLEGHAGIACIALGWVFAFAAAAASPEATVPEEYSAAFMLLFCAIATISFGVGWVFRSERERGSSNRVEAFDMTSEELANRVSGCRVGIMKEPGIEVLEGLGKGAGHGSV